MPDETAELDDGSVEVTFALEPEPEPDENAPAVQAFRDGGMAIDFGGPATASSPPSKEEEAPDFSANLALHISDSDLNRVGSDIVDKVEADERSRQEWLEVLSKGLKLLGLKIEERTVPWPKACGVFHPVLTESVIRFEAQAIMEVFPAKGPVKTKIIGEATPEREAQAKRIRQDLNWMACELMEDYRSDTEQLLFNLPIAGSAFRKGFWDPVKKQPQLSFVPAEDFIAPYEATSLAAAERYTHRIRMTPNEVRKQQVAGLYRDDVRLPKASPTPSDSQQARDEETGRTQTLETDERHEILECHTVYDLPGFEDPDGVELPYIVTVERDSRKVLSIYRNWRESDETRKRRMWFAEYKYLPGLGFYGLGLIHIIGSLTKGATSAMRQLVDSGTLNNLPSGYKTRDLRVKGDNTPIMPGEWRDVDVMAGNLKDSFFPLPMKEPSGVLYQLMGNMVEEARRLGSVVDLKISDMSQQAPVGTTFALLERSMKVQSAVQARLHASMRQELRMLAELARDHMSQAPYPFDTGGEHSREQDYDDRVDVEPVSDPNASTMAQRIMQHQAALELSGTAPELYNRRLLHRGMITAMGLDNPEEIVPDPPDVKPRDPVTENMDLLNGRPVRAGIGQDHEAHLKVHLALLEDPKIGEVTQNSPNQSRVAGAISAHVVEHLAFQYRREIEQELGVPLPPPGAPLPEDVEVRLSRLTAEAADRLLKRDIAEHQQRELLEKIEDPVVQMQRRELELKEADLSRKAAVDKSRIEQQEADRQANLQIEREKMAMEIAQALFEAGVEVDKTEIQREIQMGKAAVDVVKEIIKTRLAPRQSGLNGG